MAKKKTTTAPVEKKAVAKPAAKAEKVSDIVQAKDLVKGSFFVKGNKIKIVAFDANAVRYDRETDWTKPSVDLTLA